MFQHVLRKFQQASLFEKLLLIIGVIVGVFGFWLINQVYTKQPKVDLLFISVIFAWLSLIFLIILTDSNESIKEELGIIIREHVEETKLLKQEVSLLRLDLKNINRRKK